LRPLTDGLRYLAENWPSSIFWWFGVLWILVFLLVLGQSRSGAITSFIALILIPGAAVVLTYDGNRVFWLVSVVVTIALIRFFSVETDRRPQSVILLPFVYLLVILLPVPGGGAFFAITTVYGLGSELVGILVN